MSFEPSELRDILKSGLVLMSVSFSDKQVEQLLIYVDELIRWNKVYNLTSVREPKDILYKHILDSLSVLGLLDGSQRILDVGAGAGLPGIPLAILRPELNSPRWIVIIKKHDLWLMSLASYRYRMLR